MPSVLAGVRQLSLLAKLWWQLRPRAASRWTSKVDTPCEKLATELSQQCFASKVTNLQLPHLDLSYATCICCLHWVWLFLSFAEIFGIQKLEFLGYCLACLRDPMFRHFSRTSTCDRRMESRTVRHHNSSYLAGVERVKWVSNTLYCSINHSFYVWQACTLLLDESVIYCYYRNLLTYRCWILCSPGNGKIDPHVSKHRIKCKLKSSLWSYLD